MKAAFQENVAGILALVCAIAVCVAYALDAPNSEPRVAVVSSSR